MSAGSKLTDEERAKFEPSLRVASQRDLENAERFMKVRELLEQRKGTFYVTEIILKGVEGSDQTKSYGDMIYRKWKASEVMPLLADMIFQKANAIEMRDGMAQPKILTVEEQKHVYELFCEYIFIAQSKNSPLTKEFLMELDDWPYIRACFHVIATRSGLNAAFDKDLEQFFRGK